MVQRWDWRRKGRKGKVSSTSLGCSLVPCTTKGTTAWSALSPQRLKKEEEEEKSLSSMCMYVCAGLGLAWLFGAPRAQPTTKGRTVPRGAGAAELRARAGTCDLTGPARTGRPKGRRTDSRVPDWPRELTQISQGREKGEADSVPKS